jgi:hypothetical protein
MLSFYLPPPRTGRSQVVVNNGDVMKQFPSFIPGLLHFAFSPAI